MKQYKKENNEIKRNTTNYPMDSHKNFCERCFKKYNNGTCPANGKKYPSTDCNI